METKNNINPKVFISHASEDKDRFVVEFAKRLRHKGIDAWVDRWEMLPGDSIVDKIFEEGIKNAQAIIIVVSNNSINKKWVREELNSAVVNKINKSSKLIPVIIDDCKVPEVLKSTVWEHIKDLENYDKEFERIVMSIFGKYEKPPLGKAPAYTKTKVDPLPNLTEIDTIIFKTSCDMVIAQGMQMLDTESLIDNLKSYEITREVAVESLHILDRRGYIKSQKFMSGDIPGFNVTWRGLDKYLRYYFSEYSNVVDAVVYKIVNENKDNTNELITDIKQPKVIINCVLELLESRRLIYCTKTMNGIYYVNNITPELKRMIRTGQSGIGG